MSENVGTPPHAWGKLGVSTATLMKARYTPTCVGKTLETARKLDKTKVHPHMRGENVNRAQVHFFHHGTPPHAWGKLSLRLTR